MKKLQDTEDGDDLCIGDEHYSDGTTDIIVCYKGEAFIFSNEYRLSFDDDEHFLEEIKEEVVGEYEHKKAGDKFYEEG